MPGLTVGIYGKLPSQPDFVAENVSPEISSALYEWAQQSIYHSRETMGNHDWLSAYLVSPIWRTCLALGAKPDADSESIVLAIMVPSVDSVGRFFPLFLLFEVDVEFIYMEWVFRPASTIYQALEECALMALQQRLSVADLKQVITEKTAEFDISVPHSNSEEASESFFDYSPVQFESQDVGFLLGVQLKKLKRSFWWTKGQLNGVDKPFVRCQALPTPQEYQFLLSGNVENLEIIKALVEL